MHYVDQKYKDIVLHYKGIERWVLEKKSPPWNSRNAQEN